MANPITRRQVLASSAAVSAGVVVATVGGHAQANQPTSPMPQPPMNHRFLLSCKLSMIKEPIDKSRPFGLTERLKLAREAGFDGVDLDEAGKITTHQARQAVIESGVFVHNAINHDHWKQRFTSPTQGERAKALSNLEHCIRVSHAAGGSGVLIVVGHSKDGPEEEINERAREEISKALPLAAALGQHILFENVWSGMFYDHDKGPEQPADRWADFVDSFDSPWIGMYHDIGNHWKYANPGDWIRTFGKRAVKFDVKGFSRAQNKFTDIGQGDLPWDDVRKALDEFGFTGWFTAEVGGGGLERLKTVRKQMAEALGVA